MAGALGVADRGRRVFAKHPAAHLLDSSAKRSPVMQICIFCKDVVADLPLDRCISQKSNRPFQENLPIKGGSFALRGLNG